MNSIKKLLIAALVFFSFSFSVSAAHEEPIEWRSFYKEKNIIPLTEQVRRIEFLNWDNNTYYVGVRSMEADCFRQSSCTKRVQEGDCIMLYGNESTDSVLIAFQTPVPGSQSHYNFHFMEVRHVAIDC